MADFNNFSLGSQLPQTFNTTAPSVAAPPPAPVPPAKPGNSNPFSGGILSNIFNPSGMVGAVSPFGDGGNPLGGLLSMLFGGGAQKKPVDPVSLPIDQRPQNIQNLVSMFSKGGQQ